MRQRSNLVILFGIAFFLIGGVLVYLVLGGDLGDSTDACRDRGGVPVSPADDGPVVCIDPSALR